MCDRASFGLLPLRFGCHVRVLPLKSCIFICELTRLNPNALFERSQPMAGLTGNVRKLYSLVPTALYVKYKKHSFSSYQIHTIPRHICRSLRFEGKHSNINPIHHQTAHDNTLYPTTAPPTQSHFTVHGVRSNKCFNTLRSRVSSSSSLMAANSL